MDVYKRLEELGITLPEPPKPVGLFVTATRVGNLVYLPGRISCEVEAIFEVED